MANSDKRKSKRKQVTLSATACSEDRDWFACTVRDASETGCRIAIPPVVQLKSSIEIAPRGLPGLIHGRVVWRKDGQAGVEFVEFVPGTRSDGAKARPPAVKEPADKTGEDDA